MKWILRLLLIAALATLGYFVAAHFSGGSLPTFGLEIGGEKATVRANALKFWEDIKFKDTTSALTFLPNGKNSKVLLNSFLQKTFQCSPEKLDIEEYRIENLELDSTGKRARVKVKIWAHNLSTNKALEPQVLLFFHFDHITLGWMLDLSSSF